MRPVSVARPTRLRAAAAPGGGVSSLLRLSRTTSMRLPSLSELGTWAERAAQPLRVQALANSAAALPSTPLITRLWPSDAANGQPSSNRAAA